MLRLELTTAVVASKIGYILRKELEYEDMKETYWTDSKTVLGYMNKKMQEDFTSSWEIEYRRFVTRHHWTSGTT